MKQKTINDIGKELMNEIFKALRIPQLVEWIHRKIN